MGPLKQFLIDNLPENYDTEGDIISDALVLIRRSRISDGGEVIDYVTSIGLPFTTARGMIQCVHEQMITMYSRVIEEQDDD